MHLRLLPLLAFLLFSVPVFSQNTSDGWVFKHEKEGIKVYYRKTADVHELKLITSLKVGLPGLVTLLSEVDNYPKWGYKVSESRELNKVSEWETYYYSRLDFPWPLDDRDIVVRSRMEQDPVTRRITATSVAVPDYLPVNKGVVRMRNAHTSWTLVPGPGGWTYVEYYIYSDPGGSLPDWLINMALDVGPRETIKNIRNFVRQDKYQSAKLAHLKD
ncbi:MAG: START domain-containing protein [Saprospiraceae bacterium]|nr:START domain-containing protein [Saprospiraceae bacterium]